MSISNNGGGNNSSLYQFIKNNNQDVDYLCIEDFFDGNGGYGTGKVETILGNNGTQLHIDTCLDEIKSEVGSWLNSKGYNTAMDAITSGDSVNTLTDRYVYPVTDARWNAYWQVV